MNENINMFKTVEVESPVDVIIRQIRDLISSGHLKAGDKLPSERQLSQQLGLGRNYVREAIKKLEFYGILKTIPQSGTVVAGIGITALEGLISNVLKLEKSDFESLVETRIILGVEAVRLAAQRRTSEDIEHIQLALDAFALIAKDGKAAVDEDFLFHLKIIEAGKNPVIKSLLMLVIPQIIEYYNTMGICTQGKSLKALEEHKEIFEAIIAQDIEKSGQLMHNHLQVILESNKV